LGAGASDRTGTADRPELLYVRTLDVAMSKLMSSLPFLAFRP